MESTNTKASHFVLLAIVKPSEPFGWLALDQLGDLDANCACCQPITYPRLARNSGFVFLASVHRAALIDSDAELVPARTSAVDIQTGGIIGKVRRVDDPLESSIENNRSANDLVRAFGRNVCCLRFVTKKNFRLDSAGRQSRVNLLMKLLGV